MPQPNKIPRPFADSGDKNSIPDSSGALGFASWQEGFPVITGTPFAQGGVAPKRADFNGIFNALSAATVWQQQGGVYAYDATTDYEVGNVVEYSGNLYKCITANGPSSAVKAPTDTTVWDAIATASGYLSLAGGTLTGAVVFSGLGQIIRQADNTHQISILSGINGDAEQGAKVILNGAGYSSEPGAFVLQAGDVGGYQQLLGKPDGTLTWDGRDVATIQTGTFTPSLAGSETAGEATYSTRKGYYVRVGSLVYITGEVNGSFNTLPSGRVVLNGLPYSAGTIGEQASIVVYGHSGGVSNSISRLVNATVYNNFLRLHVMSSRETAAQGLGKMDWASWSTTSGDSYYIHITPENASFRLFWGGCYMVS